MKLLFAVLLATTASASAGDAVIKSTLLLPKETGKPVPVVLLIAGSGPTDRDGNSAMLPGKNNNLKMLAEGLAMNGIASLRYDKRGVGESAAAMVAESELRFDTYVDDAVAFCEQLRADQRFSGVVIVGHSEGSLVGMAAAKRCNAAGFVSLAGAGRPAATILREQLAGKLPPEMAAKSEAALKSLEAGRTTTEAPPELAALFRPGVQPYLISWFKYDPPKLMADLKVPVLIVQGTADQQVTAADAKALAAANPRAKLLMIEGMNHVLKRVASTDPDKQMASYSDPNLQLAEGLLPAVVELVRRAASR